MQHTTTGPADTQAERLDGPIHLWFNLTYSNYLVLCRSMMQSMPVAWQQRAVALFDELDAAFPDLERPESYVVMAARECQYSDLSPFDMEELGITGPTNDDDDDGRFYHDRRGDQHEPWETLLVPILGGDPVPHYNRGRTYIAPAERATS